MTREQAISEELRRYLVAIERKNTRRARIHRKALDRVRFPYVAN